MILGRQDHFEFRRDRTQEEENTVVDLVGTLGRKITEGLEKRRDGTPAKSDV